MQRRWAWVSLLAAGAASVWLWPVPVVPPERLYAAADPDRVRSLMTFRRSFPPRKLAVDGAVWEYVALGQGRDTLVFLHGMTGAYDIWWQQLDAFRRRFRVVSVTYPPVGSLRQLETGVLAVLEKERVGPAILVGTSLGGYLAQYLASRHVGRWGRLVLGNTFPPNDRIAAQNRLLGSVLPYLPEWLVLAQFRRNFQRVIFPSSDRDPLTLGFLNEMGYGRMRKAHLVARYRCVIEKFEVRPARVPVLILESDNDPLVEPALRDQLKTTYPGAATYTFRGAGHFPYLNRPEEYNGVLSRFLEGR